MEFIYWLKFLLLLQIQWIITTKIKRYAVKMKHTPQMDSSLNCSQYASDDRILKSFPFGVQTMPVLSDLTKTYAEMYENRTVYLMHIANQRFVPSMIYCLKHLEQLTVRNTPFADYRYPNHVIPSLTHLTIHGTKISHLIRRIGKFKNLQHLELSNNYLKSLPDAIGNLSSLVSLTISQNKLKSLPDTIGNLSSLTSLIISETELESLPITIGNLRLLRYITLRDNSRLQSIQSINGLPSLHSLDTNHCPIRDLPQYLPKLTDLHMSHNSLTDLDGIEGLGNETNKEKYFYFDSNKILLVPWQIRLINNLHWLNLNHNQLDNLPRDIFNVSNLRHLYLRGNRFNSNEKNKIAIEFNSIQIQV